MRNYLSIIAACLALASPTFVRGQTWNNSTTNFSWNDPANWTGGLPTIASLANFSNTGAGTITLDGDQSALGLVFTNTVGYIFNPGAAGTLTIGASGISSSTAGAVTINPQIVLGADQSWAFTGAGGSLTVSNVNLNAFGLTIGATNVANVNINGVISGTGAASSLAFTQAGGTTTLAVANTYTGITTIAGGTLRLGVNGSLPTTTAVSFLTPGPTATLDLQGTSQTIANMTFLNTGAATVNILGTAGSSLTVSPSTLTIAPSGALINLTVNMSSLGAFTYNNATGTVTINNGASANPATNAVLVNLSATANNITAATLNLGNSTTGAGVIGTTVNLGTTNVLRTNTIRFGNGRVGGTLKFATGLTNPILTITGAAGGASLATLNLGQSHDSNTLTGTPTDLFDTTLGTLNAQFGVVTIGQNLPTAGNRTIVMSSSLLMGAGTLNATSMNVGIITNRATPTPASTLNSRLTALFSLTGGTANITTLTLATSQYTDTFTGTNLLSGTASLNAGATLNATTIAAGAIATPTAGTLPVTSQILWNDGTIANIAGGDLSITGAAVILSGASANHAFNISGTQTGTINSILSGTGSITKAGTGLLIYGGANTYTGGTTVNAGTLRIVGGTLGNTGNTLTVEGGTVDLNGTSQTIGALVSSNASTGTVTAGTGTSLLTLGTGNAGGSYFGALANGGGTLNLTKTGTGSQIIAGPASFTGSTIVNAGTLQFNVVPATTAITVAGGASIAFNTGAAAHLTSLTGFNLGAGTPPTIATIGLQLGAPDPVELFGTGGTATVANTIKFNIEGLGGFGIGSYTLLRATGGGLTSSSPTYTVGNAPAGFVFTFNNTDNQVILNAIPVAPTPGIVYWSGAGGTAWNNANNLTGHSSNFTTDEAGTTTMLGFPTVANTVVFSSTASTVGSPTTATVLERNFTIRDLIFNSNTNTGTITAASIGSGSGINTLTLTPISPSAGITVQAGAPASVSITSPVALGAAQTWSIADAATNLTVSGGLTGTVNLTKTGAGRLTLSNVGSAFSGALDATGPLTIGGDTTPSTLTSLAGTAPLTKSGTQTLNLPNANTYSGGTTLTAGTIVLGNAASLGTGTPIALNGGTLTNSTGAAFTFPSSLALSFGGSFTLAGANIFDFGTTGVTLTANSSVTVSVPSLSIVSPITGAFSLGKSGTGPLTLSAINTFSGGTTVAGGVVNLIGGDNRLLPTAPLSFAGVSTLALDVNNQTVSAMSLDSANATAGTNATITGTGTLTVTGSNFLVGPNTGSTSNAHILNMAGLGAFVYNGTTSTFRVGLGTTNSGAIGQIATLSLAANNTITAATFAVGDIGGGNDGGISTVNLGTVNNLRATTFNVGFSGRSDANMQFQAGLTNPTVSIRGTNGTGPATTFNIGSMTQFSTAAQLTFTDSVNFSLGTTDALVTNMTIGSSDLGTQTGRGGTVNASLTLGAGSLTTTTLNLGRLAGTTATLTGNVSTNGTFTINNGGTLNVTTATLATYTLAATDLFTRTVTGTIALTDGTVKATTITRGAQTGFTTGVTVTVTPRINWANGTIQNTDGANLTISDVPVVLAAGTHTFNITGAAQAATLNAGSIISGVSGIVKNGVGTLSLGAPSTYAGGTTVNAGALLANNTAGSATGVGAVSVAAGATLGGSGFIVPSTGAQATNTVTVAGILAPGNSPGTLTIGSGADAATVVVSGTYNFEVATAGTSSAAPGGSTPPLPQTNHDLLVVNGSLNVSGMVVNITSFGTTGFVPTQPYSWLIATATPGSLGVTPTAPSFGAAGGEFNVPGIFTVSTDVAAGNVYLNFTPVPEPASMLALAALAWGCHRLRRRRA